MEKLHYRIEVRDKDFKLYKTELGSKVTGFEYTHEEKDENLVNLICLTLYNNYKAVCKEGSIITIDVSYFNTFTETYSTLYSFDGEKFNKY